MEVQAVNLRTPNVNHLHNTKINSVMFNIAIRITDTKIITEINIDNTIERRLYLHGKSGKNCANNTNTIKELHMVITNWQGD